MRHSLSLVLLAAALAAAQAEPARGESRVTTWAQAAAQARAQGRMIFAFYLKGSVRPGTPKASGQDAGSADPSPPLPTACDAKIVTTLASPEVRAITARSCTVAMLRESDPGNMWDRFKPLAPGGAVFATPDGEFLAPLSDQASPDEFVAGFNKAQEKFGKIQERALRLATLLKEAAAAVKAEDYRQAIAAVREVQAAADAQSPEAARAGQIEQTMDAKANDLLRRAGTLLKAGKAADAFRALDEAAHLFAGLEPAGKAAEQLAALLADPKWAEPAAAYAKEHAAYGLYDEAVRLRGKKDFGGACAKFREVVAQSEGTPLARRAAAQAAECRKQIKSADANPAAR